MTEGEFAADLENLRGQDAAARRAALDPARSVIVQAPAGSGKTELLIQRYLALLARVDSPEEIIAITFTRKATAEMRARVLDALLRAENDTPPAKPHEFLTWRLARGARSHDSQARWNIAENPNRLRIQTIDSLCHWLTLQLPMLSGFGAQPETLEEADELYLEAARRTLAGLGSDSGWSSHVATLLRHLDNHAERAQQLLADMLGVRDQWIRSVTQAQGKEREVLEAALANATRDALASLAARIPEEARAELVALAAHAAENLEATGKASPIRRCLGVTAIPGSAPEDLDAWRAIAELLLNQSGCVRRTADARVGFPAPSDAKGAERRQRKDMKTRFEALLAATEPHRTFVEQLRFTRMLPPSMYSEAQWRIVAGLVRLLPVAVAQLEVLFRERGEVDFTAVAQAAVRALGAPEAPTDLALALDCRVRHLLIDEFQDTSWSQYDLLQGLTAGWQRDDGRTLFVVGDALRLAVNFRSTRAIVDWFNRTFHQVLPDAEDLASGAVPFAPSVADDGATEGVTPELYPLLAMEREAEARLVTELVERTRAEDPGQSIAILVRSRSHLVEIAPALKAAGLGFQAIEIEQLGHRPVVQDLAALTRALVHPADRVAWLAMLRAPWCGLTLADLEALAGSDHDAALWTLINDSASLARISEDGTRRLNRVREALGQALARRRREPLRRWVEAAWLTLGGPACTDDAGDLEDAQVFLRLLEELEEGGDLPRVDTLEERVAALYALPDSGADAARLQLMTIHKAKGLQFDTVILPGLGYSPRRADPRLLLWLERPRIRHPLPSGEKVGVRDGSDLLLAPIREASAEKDAIYEYLRELDRAKEDHEAARLLYVAATRAKSRLHLIGQVQWKEGSAAKPKARSLLEHLWPVVAPAFEQAIAQVETSLQPRAVISAAAPHAIRRLVSGWRLPKPPAGIAWRPRAEIVYEARSPLDEVEFSWASETAKHVGTVVHGFLQWIAKDGLERWNAQRIGGMHDAFACGLAPLGVPQSEMQSAVARVAEALTANITDERGRWVLGAQAEARSELRLTGALAGEIVSVAIDRTFVDEHGTRWIVDYKTGIHAGGDPEGFLDREQERYRAQLERYAALVRELDRRPIRLGLYFPLLRGWREWAF